MNASGTNLFIRACPRIAASLVATAVVIFMSNSEGKAQPPGGGPTKTVQGTVRSATNAPMGEIDGAVLDDGTVIHWPPHLGDRMSGLVIRGDQIRVTGYLETGPEGDTHLEVRTITNLRTNASFENDGDGASTAAGSRPCPTARADTAASA